MLREIQLYIMGTKMERNLEIKRWEYGKCVHTQGNNVAPLFDEQTSYKLQIKYF